MVHNGIEYGLMQLLAEAYDFSKRGLGLTNEQIAVECEKWTEGPFGGFLTSICADVLKVKDPDTGKDLVDLVLDKAKQKGTGKWTSQDAMDLGIPIPTIDAAVSARQLSGLKDERVEIEKVFGGPVGVAAGTKEELGEALHLAFLATYAQGIALLEAASVEHGMEIDIAQSAKVWRAGCIIRSKLLEPIRQAVAQKPAGQTILMSPQFKQAIETTAPSLRKTVGQMVVAGIPAPCFSASLAYFDGLRTGRLPANLIQAMRDYFGAHTYERTDKPGTFHTDWGDQ
jgi:6-phosphogluconate dehydrogenase